MEKWISEINKEISDKDYYLLFRISGGESMYPLLRDKDIIKVKQTSISDIRLGDITLYSSRCSGIVAHRVIEKRIINNRLVCITKGDNNRFYSEERILPKDIIGRIVSIKRDKQTIKLDSLANKLKAAFYTKILNLFKWFYFVIFKRAKDQIRHRMLGGLLQRLQGLNIYKYFVRRILEDKIDYRIATCQDVPSLAKLLRVWYQPVSLQEAMKHLYKVLKGLENSGYCFIAQKGNRLIGALTVEKITGFSYGCYTDNSCRAETLHVDWRYRGIGVAEQLSKLAIKKFLEEGSFICRAMVFENNFRVINLVRKLGFYPIKKFSKKIIFILRSSDISI